MLNAHTELPFGDPSNLKGATAACSVCVPPHLFRQRKDCTAHCAQPEQTRSYRPSSRPVLLAAAVPVRTCRL